MIFFDYTNVEFEEFFLSNTIKSQKLIQKSILKYIDKIADEALKDSHISYDYLLNIRDALYKAIENIELIEKLQNLLISIKDDSTKHDLINEYNSLYKTNFSIIEKNNSSIQEIILSILDFVYFDFPNSVEPSNMNSKNLDTAFSDEIATNNTHKNHLDIKENMLIISEKNHTVTLPYKISELENILKQDNSYSSLDEIIKNKYTLPIDYYKHSSLARFKEAYKLVKYRSGGSTKEAFDLGLEVLLKYNLNPAIITACKNLDEFDVYLSCLDDNVLNEFPYFEIIYEALPTVVTKPHK